SVTSSTRQHGGTATREKMTRRRGDTGKEERFVAMSFFPRVTVSPCHRVTVSPCRRVVSSLAASPCRRVAASIFAAGRFLDNAEDAPLLSFILTWRGFLTWECGVEYSTGGIGSRAVREDRRVGRRGGRAAQSAGAARPPGSRRYAALPDRQDHRAHRNPAAHAHGAIQFSEPRGRRLC